MFRYMLHAEIKQTASSKRSEPMSRSFLLDLRLLEAMNREAYPVHVVPVRRQAPGASTSLEIEARVQFLDSFNIRQAGDIGWSSRYGLAEAYVPLRCREGSCLVLPHLGVKTLTSCLTQHGA